MSELRIYDETRPGQPVGVYHRYEDIHARLADAGVDFERWEASHQLDDQATQDEVIEAYREPINALMNTHGFKSLDVISMYPDHPQKQVLRDKFLAEHTHDEYEVRFFVDGSALFYLHTGGQVLGMLCERGDLLSVPANMTHWFDMGPQPSFKAIRLFVTPEGWVANFTGDSIADRFPRFEAPHYHLSQAA